MNYAFINMRKRELGLTNLELAKQTGITVSTLDKITSGANQNPKLETMQALARALKCSLDDFDDEHTPAVDAMTTQELLYLRRYRDLDDIGQETVRSVIDIEHKRVTVPAPLPFPTPDDVMKL